jgi:hypothetical protein
MDSPLMRPHVAAVGVLPWKKLPSFVPLPVLLEPATFDGARDRGAVVSTNLGILR